jgi:putative membrane protein
MTDLLLAIAHHLFAFFLLGFLVAEWALLLDNPTRKIVERLPVIDFGYGVAAVGSFFVGLARLFFGIRPTSFYTDNWIFWLKISLWASIGLLSIIPTLRFLSWRRQTSLPTADDFAKVRHLITIELILFIGIPILEALMARGVGY